MINQNKNSIYDVFNSQNATCLKGIAIIMLLTHHCFYRTSCYEGTNITFIMPEGFWNYIALFCKVCVAIFVFISAYGLTKKLMQLSQEGTFSNDSIKIFISSRLIKMLSGYIFVFLLVAVFAVFWDPGRFIKIYGNVLPDAIEYFFIDLLGLAELFDTPAFRHTYWYYSLAILIILAIPALYQLMKRIGSCAFLSLIFVLNFTLQFENSNFSKYLLCVAVGMVCASENIITKLVNLKVYNKFVKFICECILIGVLIFLRQGALKVILWPVWDAVLPVIITAFCCEYIFFSIPKKIFLFLGTYSANIFLVHQHIRSTWFRSFTYSFKYPLIIVLTLLLISLVLSIFIERLKKFIHFDAMVNKLLKSLQKIIITETKQTLHESN